MPSREIEQLLLILFARHPAQRIRGRGVQQQTSSRRDRGLERVEVDAVVVATKRLSHLPRSGVRHRHDRRAVGPGGSQHQSFVAGIEHGTQRDIQSLHTRCRDDDLGLWVQVHRLQLLVICRDCSAQRWQSGVFGVESVAVGQCAHRRLLDVLGRGQI